VYLHYSAVASLSRRGVCFGIGQLDFSRLRAPAAPALPHFLLVQVKRCSFYNLKKRNHFVRLNRTSKKTASPSPCLIEEGPTATYGAVEQGWKVFCLKSAARADDDESDGCLASLALCLHEKPDECATVRAAVKGLAVRGVVGSVKPLDVVLLAQNRTTNERVQ